jgi:hypothetical protein
MGSNKFRSGTSGPHYSTRKRWGTRLVSLSNLYIKTGWEKLKDRRERHRTIQCYKMSNNLTPQYLSNLIPQNFGMIHDIERAALHTKPSV